ncbi:AraC family transcriptional regulator [Brevibacterium sp. CBA3109]|uniref:AraC family transcriptional regulator n=1 Tax=Brevibacterium koreense TaxID=3140787 RepID=A0AAU7UPY8_9MICO
MDSYPKNHELGRIDDLLLEDSYALSRDVPLNLPAIQRAWPEFESSFDSLRGRRMMGLFYDDLGVYRMASVRLDRDVNNDLNLDETVVPGGSYLRLRLRGRAPEIYEQIAPAFDVLFAFVDHDASRPHIEYYRRAGEIDCLVPTVSTV